MKKWVPRILFVLIGLAVAGIEVCKLSSIAYQAAGLWAAIPIGIFSLVAGGLTVAVAKGFADELADAAPIL